MAARFGAPAQQYASPQRPGYARLGSSPNVNGAGVPAQNGGPGPGPSGPGYGMQHRQASGGGGQRKPDRKDTKEVAWVHWRALKDFLTAWGDKGAFDDKAEMSESC